MRDMSDVEWASGHMVTCPNCHEEGVDGEDLGDHPGYLNYECPNCGRCWDSEGEVHKEGTKP